MGNFEEISRQLGQTFTELENAQGTAKREWLRKAHLLLLQADKIIEDTKTGEPSFDGNSFNGNVAGQNVAAARRLLRAFAEDGARSAERGPCRGLQTVLVLRPRRDQAKGPEPAAKSRAQRAGS